MIVLKCTCAYTRGFTHKFLIMEPIIFVNSFSIEGYNVFVNIKFFPHAIIMEDSLLIGPFDDVFGDVNTLLNLWNYKQLEVYTVLFYFIAKSFSCYAISLLK